MRLIETPDNPIPAGARLSSLTTPDGMRLRAAAWPGRGRTVGTVCLLQGRAEFIEKYFETIGELTARGYAVMTFDWRSQGGSQRTLADARKGYVRSFADYETDLRTFLAERVLGTCARPLIGLAHSMGAAILLAHIANPLTQMEAQFDRVVLTSPMIALPGLASSRLAECVAGALHAIGLGSAFIPGGGSEIMDARPFAGNLKTSDPVRYRRSAGIVAAEPSLGLGSPTIGWTHAVLAFMRYLRGLPPGRLACDRVAVVASEHDAIVSFDATRTFVARHANATLHPIGGGARHELLMETDRTRQAFWSVFDATAAASDSACAPSPPS
jgi:lysophospholipase